MGFQVEKFFRRQGRFGDRLFGAETVALHQDIKGEDWREVVRSNTHLRANLNRRVVFGKCFFGVDLDGLGQPRRKPMLEASISFKRVFPTMASLSPARSDLRVFIDYEAGNVKVTFTPLGGGAATTFTAGASLARTEHEELVSLSKGGRYRVDVEVAAWDGSTEIKLYSIRGIEEGLTEAQL